MISVARRIIASKCPNFKNKRQQYCCYGSLSAVPRLILPPVPQERTTTPAVRQISSEHESGFRHCTDHGLNGYLRENLSFGVQTREI